MGMIRRRNLERKVGCHIMTRYFVLLLLHLVFTDLVPSNYCCIMYLRQRRSHYTLFSNGSNKPYLSPASTSSPGWWPKEALEGSSHSSI